MIKTIPMAEGWKSDVAERGFTADKVFDKGQLEDLKAKLLSFGGEAVCLPVIEEDKKAIMARGELLLGKKVKMMKGKPISCHENTSNLWFDNKDRIVIMTGYGLSEDGMWRQHTN